MITHTLTARYGGAPSPFGGVLVDYLCTCGLEFASASNLPECPRYRDYEDGLRRGARDKRKRVTTRRQDWMSRAYYQGYAKGRGLSPQPPYPNAVYDPEGHREARFAEAVREATHADDVEDLEE